MTKKTYLLLTLSSCLLFIVTACHKDKIGTSYDWQRIDVPDAQTVYSFSGNIEDELIVGNSGEIRKTNDQGANWRIVHDNIIAYELRQHQDTLIAVAFYNETYDDYFSLDNGDTWEAYPGKSLEDLRAVQVTTTNGIIYKIQYVGSFPKQPDEVLRSADGGNTWTSIFPFKRYIYSIYLDEDDRLYLGTIGWEWNEYSASFENDPEQLGIIYHMKE